MWKIMLLPPGVFCLRTAFYEPLNLVPCKLLIVDTIMTSLLSGIPA